MIGSKQQQENLAEYSDLTENRYKDIEEGEEICSKCDGTGVIPSTENPSELASVCWKCNGNGKVDWITNAMGQPRQSNYSSSGIGFASTSGYGIVKNALSVITTGKNQV